MGGLVARGGGWGSLVGEYMEKLDGGGLMLGKGRSSVYPTCDWSILQAVFYSMDSFPHVLLEILSPATREKDIMNISLTSFSRSIL